MPHIHTQPGQHDHTVSAFIVRLDGPEPTLILHRHKKLGFYMQFGGHIELDETPWQAITHELAEESGYALNQLAILQPKDRIEHLANATTHPFPVSYNTHPFGDDGQHFHTDTTYAFVTNQAPKGIPQQNESQDHLTISRQELFQNTKNIHENIRQIGLFVFDVCLKKWDKISADTI